MFYTCVIKELQLSYGKTNWCNFRGSTSCKLGEFDPGEEASFDLSLKRIEKLRLREFGLYCKY